MRSALIPLVLVASAGLALGQVDPRPATRPQVQSILPNLAPRHWGYSQPVEVSGVTATIDISRQIATTVLEITLRNPASFAQEAQVLLPVPEGVVVRSLSYDGVGTDVGASVLRKDEARRIYEDIVRSMKDPALVEFVGTSLVKTSAFPIPAGASQKVQLTLEQVLTSDAGRIDYTLLRSESLALASNWNISGTIRSDLPISTLYSPTHDISHERSSQGEIRFRVQNTAGNAADKGSVRVSYLVQPQQTSEPSFTVFTCPGDTPDTGYFMVLGGLPATRTDDQVTKPREITMVIDRSGSMRNEKIAQAKDAARQILAGLQPGEFFNIIDYSDSVSSFAPQPIAVDQTALDRAAKYITSIEANGGTNIHQALLEATQPAAAASHLPIILFLTDGLPTVGERDEVKIRDAVKASNDEGRRIFPFGVGFDVNVPLLTKLADSSRGAPTFVLPNENVETKVSQVYRRLKGPVLASPVLTAADPASDGRVAELMPRIMGDVFDGDQIIVMGTYRATSKVTLALSGEFFGKQLTSQISFDPRQASYTNSFVPRLWAERKVTSLIDEIRQAGAEGLNTSDPRVKELVDEIVRLSTKYGILTEYTSFLATEKEKFRDADRDGVIDEAAARATTNLKDNAVQQRWGAAAVRQQMDLQAKQSGLQAASNAYYMNEKLEREEVTNVLYFGDRAFFLRDNRWIDSRLLADEDAKPDQEIVFGSAEYFELAATLAAKGRQNALTFDKDAVILVDQKRVLIRR